MKTTTTNEAVLVQKGSAVNHQGAGAMVIVLWLV